MRPARQADCHPARRHEAHGLCAACYDRKRLARGPRRPRWTTDEDRALAIAWPSGGAMAASEALGRSPQGCGQRARALGLPSPASGCLSVAAFARAAGYSHGRIDRAIVDIGITLRAAPLRCPTYGDRARRVVRSALTPADQARLLAHLTAAPVRAAIARPGGRNTPAIAWGTGRKPPHCHRCHRSDRPHKSRGYCVSCATTARREGLFAAPHAPPPSPPVARPSPPPRAPFDSAAVSGELPAAIARRLRVAKASAPDVSAAVVEAFDDASRAGHKREWLPDGYLIRKGAA